MTYATPAELLTAVGPVELAQVATPEHLDVADPDLLVVTIGGGDVSAWNAESQASATAALDRINQALASACGIIDGYLGERYDLPFGSVPVVLRTYTIDIARYRLQKDADDDSAAKQRYDDAMTFLGMLASGKVTLGVSDPQQSSTSSGVEFDSGDKQFGRQNRVF